MRSGSAVTTQIGGVTLYLAHPDEYALYTHTLHRAGRLP